MVVRLIIGDDPILVGEAITKSVDELVGDRVPPEVVVSEQRAGHARASAGCVTGHTRPPGG